VKFYIKTQMVLQGPKEELIVSCIDEELKGKILKENKIEIKLNEPFYGETLVDKEKMIKLIKMATIANIFGKNAIESLIDEKIIEKENIKIIDKVPHAQIIKFS